jgi:hypothetical protein
MTFADRPARPGDLDIVAVIEKVDPDERTPSIWRATPDSRPNHIYAAERSIAETCGLALDTTYLILAEVGQRAQPPMAFYRARRETSWAVSRAHWLAGQYVLLHGQPPEEFVVPPTSSEIRRALDRELEHLERHVLEAIRRGLGDRAPARALACRHPCRRPLLRRPRDSRGQRDTARHDGAIREHGSRAPARASEPSRRATALVLTRLG